MIFFPNATVEIQQMEVYHSAVESPTGEDMTALDTAEGICRVPADIQPYSISTDGGVLQNYPEMKEGLYYKVIIPMTCDTITVKPRDQIKVIAAAGYPELVGEILGIEKKAGRALTRHITLVVRHGHRF